MILILANSRFKGGLSGGDAIYESFKKFWPCEIEIQSLCDIDYEPFAVCYVHRIMHSCLSALFNRKHYQCVYSSSDFLPDSLAGFIYKMRGRKWIAGFYLKAFRDNKIHFYTQALVRKLITWFADMVIVTNPTMYNIFPNKKKTWINGGIDLSLAGLSDKPKIYDAVFCGRIHPSKGIDELLDIWGLVREKSPKARLAIIGDGDLGIDYIKHKLACKYGLHNRIGIDLLGYMGNERFEIYKQSKVVLYPTPLKYDHFSMAPVEAMACGCPLIGFYTTTTHFYLYELGMKNCLLPENINDFAVILADIINVGDWADKCQSSALWASQFDYKKQSLRVYEDVCQQLTLTLS